ncbi:TonB-dependent receptor [Sphingomonas profundi]|uniref:TonB-dependent receptor n=1 Tax=Alterirhizorhabdus profundi TaxID=2681549 RepID=UPI001E58F247|nr:TonB-dependent receptor [Sphingomonas profundi]
MDIGKLALLGCVSGMALLASGPALAQAVPDPAGGPTAAAGADESRSDDIVVTANKREQRLNDVGLAVAVVGGQALQNQRVSSLADLANIVPSLSYTNSANGTPVYTLRGIGFYETSLAAYPTVSIYLDEVPLSFPATTRHSVYDLERVEVLKGPQGTLFGQNATGGAINYIAAKPTRDLRAGIDLSYGRFNEVIGEGYFSGPLGEKAQMRASARIERADGWQRSNSRPGDSNGKVRNYMGRVQLALQPTETINLLLNVNGWKDKSETQAPQAIGFNIQNPFVSSLVTNSQLSPERPRASDFTPGYTRADNRMWQASLRGDLDLTDDVTLTSISAYLDYKQDQADEGDGLPISTLDLPSDQGRIKTVSQEVRLTNGSANRLRWVIGGNYEHSRIDQEILVDYHDSSSTTTLGVVFGYPIANSFYYSYQRKRNYAFFGNVEFDVLPNLTLKGGTRYTNARASTRSCNSDRTGIADNVGPFFYNILLGGAFGPYKSGACFQINDQPTEIGGVAPGAPGEYDATLKENNISWRGGIDWKPRPGLLLYGNVAKGYKAGGFPTVSSSSFVAYLPVRQESVISYEAGFKAELLDRTLQFNAAAFYYDYRNKQLRSKLNQPPFGILDILQNIPKSTVKGFEIELLARPTRQLTVNATMTYIDAKVDRFVGINAAGVAADFGGTRVPFTPKYQVGVNADYDFPLSRAIDAFVGSSMNMRSDTVSVVGGDINPATASPQGKSLFGIDSYVLVDARVGIKSQDDRWRLSLWAKNLFNTYYWNNVVAAFDTIGRYTGKPATYGVNVSYRI